MVSFSWIAQHWLDLLQSVGIVSGFVFAAITLRIDSKVQRVSNLLTITKHHREIWARLYEKPELARILEPSVDLKTQPITREEELFVSFLLFHLSTAQEAIKQGMFSAPDGLCEDVRRFFSRPIPRAIWEKTKRFQDRDLILFVEDCLTGRD